MIAAQPQPGTGAPIWRHPVAGLVVALVLVAALVGLTGGVASPWVGLFFVPIVLAGFHGLRPSIFIACVASGLFLLASLAFPASDRSLVASGAFSSALTSGSLEVVSFLVVAVVTGETMRRRAERQRRRDEETDAARNALDIQHMINAAYDLGVTLDLVVLKQRELMEVQSNAVLLVENSVLRVQGATGIGPEGRAVRIGINEDDHGWCPADGRPLVVADTRTSATRLGELDPSARSILAVPMQSVERLVGLLFFGSPEPDAFSSQAVDRAEEFANRIVFPIQRALLEEELRRLAFTDAQTNLYNHRHFQLLMDEEIRRAQRYGRPLSLIFLDLDNFKQFNDTYGHPAGDTLLRKVSDVLRSNLRVVDMAARYGGEEFVIILPETNGEQAVVLADRLREAVAQMRLSLNGEARPITVSVGVAAFPANAQNKAELIDTADKAHYEAKRAGKNRVILAGHEYERKEEG